MSTASHTKTGRNIVILGGGFCGLRTAKKLSQLLKKNPDYNIILINKTAVHVYHADLYEISTAYNRNITAACMRALKKCVCVEIKEALHGTNVKFIRGKVTSIQASTTEDGPKSITIKKQNLTIPYEYLVVALGSVINYYDVPGLEKHALPLKTLEDALALNCHVDQFFRERWEQKTDQPVHIVIGGGGATGVEYACELTGYIRKLATKYKFDATQVNISIVQGGEEFIGIGKKTSQLTEKRLHELGVQTYTKTFITNCSKNAVTIKQDHQQQELPADILIWTGGVKPNPLLKDFKGLDKKGALEVKPTLEVKGYPKVYAGGDNATIIDGRTKKPLSKLAPYACQAGSTIAKNISAAINGRKQIPFKSQRHPFFVALGGKYFICKNGKTLTKGIVPFFIHKWHDFKYFTSLSSIKTALERIRHSENIFIQNDDFS